MKRVMLFIFAIMTLLTSSANNVDVIYRGPKNIGDWGAVELSSIEFHNLEIGDTVYVYTSQLKGNAKGAFQNRNWHSIEDAINGQTITGDFEMVIDSEAKLNELKQYGLKVRGCGYTLEKIVIKHGNRFLHRVILIASVAVLLAVLCVLCILIYKNRQLRKAYQQIYMQNMKVLAAADEERRLKARYEGEIAAFKTMLQNALGGNKPKYQGSTLADDEKTILADRIVKLFEETDEIYAMDFSLNKLASLVNSSYKNISQVINEQLGKNFNTLLNEYRIQEACRRFNDLAHYGNYTVEAIGNSVGYGSRSTFVTQFKAVTGLTPSEFQAMARRQIH